MMAFPVLFGLFVCYRRSLCARFFFLSFLVLSRFVDLFFFSVVLVAAQIGYGDVANPANVLERFAAIIAMTIGSVTWAYIVGTMCALFSALHKDTTEHHHTMDKLNGERSAVSQFA